MERSTYEYYCQACNTKHVDLPALAFSSPHHYHLLSSKDKEEIGYLDEDFCTINHGDRTDRFIRVTLLQKIVNSCEVLDYGLWVSLSETSFNDYKLNFNNENHIVTYFGWLSSWIPEYETTLNIATSVYTKAGHRRPEIFPNRDGYDDSAFVRDYFDGITLEEAVRRVDNMRKSLKSE